MRRSLGVAAASLFVVTALSLTGTSQGVGRNNERSELDPGKANSQLPPEVITAWEKAGAEAGWMGLRRQQGVEYSKNREILNPAHTVPAFRFSPVRGGGWPEGFVTLPAPEQAFGLELARIATDDKMQDLARLKHLTSLHLSNSTLTEVGLKEIAGMQQLTSLRVNFRDPRAPGNRPFTDADLKILASMKQLTSLELQFTQVTDAGLKELAGLKQLAILSLSNNYKLTSAGLKELAGLERLTFLNLNQTRVSDEALKEMAGLKQLTYVGVMRSKVTDAGLKELAGLEQLATLNVAYTQVTGTGLKELTGLKRLTVLDLRGAQVTGDGLKELAGLNQLAALYLTKTPITDAGVGKLREALPKCDIGLFR